jgi:N-acetyl-gamma-glutamyl-phosphate reductase
LQDCDVVFFATPHNVAMRSVPALLEAGVRVIDLSADFPSARCAAVGALVWRVSRCPEPAAEAVYGLPERNREAIRDARLVACPGCYPTAVQLGFMPLLTRQLVDASRLIANAASGVSGAGSQARVATCSARQRQLQGLRRDRASPPPGDRAGTDAPVQPVAVTFVPHLLPMMRGIHATLYAPLNEAGKAQRPADAVRGILR